MRWAIVTVSFIAALLVEEANAQDVGTCEPSTATTLLETSGVRAGLRNDGMLFWRSGLSPAYYEVPKGSGIGAIFNAALWLGGFVDDELRVAATTYGPYEFWSGPIPEDGSPPLDCSEYDRFWSLDYEANMDREDGPVSVSEQEADWPTDLGFPFVDRNGEAGYQPDEGDYPAMNGDIQVSWIMNDLGGPHERSDGKPLGVEVQANAFGFNATNPLGYATFYRYTIRNRSSHTIRDMVAGHWVDADLGWFANDRSGTDTTLAMHFFYNATNDDDASRGGYGPNPPSLGLMILEASHINGSLPSDIQASSARHMTSARNVWGGGGIQGDPGSASDFYNLMTGRWKDGSPMTEGNWGLDAVARPMPFWMPGDPVTNSFWSETNINGNGGEVHAADRKSVVSYGLFDLAPGEWARFTFAIIWARGDSHLGSITELRRVASDLHESREAILAPRQLKPPRFKDGNPPATEQFPFWVDEPWPNPASDQVMLRMSLKWDAPVSIRLIDTLGRVFMSEEFSGSSGQRTKQLQTGDLPAGTYVIRITQRGNAISRLLVIL
jgi:hypothetical protein